MDLVFDLGNSRAKAGLFKHGNLTEVISASSINELIELIEKKELYSVNGIVSTVTLENFKKIEKICQHLYVFDQNSPLNFKNCYKSPQTLGSDRLAAIAGGRLHFKTGNLLVIDAGTCIKYNFCSEKNEFLGGSIHPGLQMRYKALHEFTGRLPLLQPGNDFQILIGSNTEESIQAGVLTALKLEIEGMIALYKNDFPELKVFLTGGDAMFLQKMLKNSIFADPFAILKGLYALLQKQL